jgi:hypothetical protein
MVVMVVIVVMVVMVVIVVMVVMAYPTLAFSFASSGHHQFSNPNHYLWWSQWPR